MTAALPVDLLDEPDLEVPEAGVLPLTGDQSQSEVTGLTVKDEETCAGDAMVAEGELAAEPVETVKYLKAWPVRWKWVKNSSET